MTYVNELCYHFKSFSINIYTPMQYSTLRPIRCYCTKHPVEGAKECKKGIWQIELRVNGARFATIVT